MSDQPGITIGGLILFVVVLAGVAWLFARNLVAPPPPTNQPKVVKLDEERPAFPPPRFEMQEPAPLAESWQVRGVDGKTVNVGSLKGKPMFINIWATWCPPCMAEMPNIEALYRSLKGKGVEFLIVSEENPATVAETVKSAGWTMPVYTSVGELPGPLQTSAIPVSFLVNAAGEVIGQHTGAAAWDSDEVREQLLKLAQNKEKSQ